MKFFFCKTFTPWLSRDCFDTDEAFFRWLARRKSVFATLRMVLIVLAVIPLLLGYVTDRRPIMLLTILPLALVLLLTVALERIDKVSGGQNNP